MVRRAIGVSVVVPILIAVAAASWRVVSAVDVQVAAMRDPTYQSSDWLAGILAGLHEGNTNTSLHASSPLAGHNISLLLHNADLTHGPYSAGMLNFVHNTSASAVAFLEPFYFHSDVVIDALRPTRKLVLNPWTIRPADYTAANDHAIFTGQKIATELVQVLTYIQHAHNCARLGVIAMVFDGVENFARTIETAYVNNGFPKPATLWIPSTAESQRDFFFDPVADRECIFTVFNGVLFQSVMQNVSGDPRFVPGAKKLFGLSPLHSERFHINNNSAIFKNTFYLRAAPAITEDNYTLMKNYKGAFAQWQPRVAVGGADRSYFLPSDAIPTAPSQSGLGGYMLARHFLALYASAAAQVPAGTVPAGSLLTDASYKQKIILDDFPMFPTVRTCSPPPFPSMCFCNSAARVLYMYEVDPVTGTSFVLSDNVTLGQRGVAKKFIPAEQCTLEVDRSVFPFRFGLLLEGSTDGVETFGHALMSFLNYADPQPPRPYRLIVESTQNQSADAVMDRMVKTVQPFVIMGSIMPVQKADVLLLFNGSDMHLEDPVLAPHGPHWNANVVNIFPVVADYIHALTLFYHENAANFTAVHAIAGTAAEAALMVKSFNTVQRNIQVFVSPDSAAWTTHLQTIITAAAATPGSNPFILVAALDSALLFVTYFVFRTASAGKLAMAIGEDILDAFRTGLGNLTSPATDVYFATTIEEFWLPSSHTRQQLTLLNDDDYKRLVDLPYMYYTYQMYAIAYQISQQSVFTNSEAAKTLYRTGTVAIGDVSMGPFSNDTCSEAIIKANRRDRTCQCPKGPRRFRVYSIQAWTQKISSAPFTDDFQWTMTTCGVHYLPLIPPSEALLNTQEIIGMIAAAGLFSLILTVFIILFVICCVGRNNWYAPKDPTKPFAMVFTDIQSSTSLWARVPVHMSDAVVKHHDLIRALIRRHNGYEVKTIGDSFMVAFTGVLAATRFAVELQEVFYAAEWVPDIDNAYKELALEAMEEAMEEVSSRKLANDGGLAPVTPLTPAAPPKHWRMADEDYPKAWHGLRVRVGIHFGFGDVKKDPVSKGYDYYGTVVNTAARVEGVGNGGQVLLTDSAYEQLPDDILSITKTQLLDLGPQPLRGLDHPVRLLQITPQALSLRVFAPLRLDVENAIEKDESSATESESVDETLTPEQLATKLTSIRSKVNITAEELMMFYQFMMTSMSTSPDTWRRETLKHFCKKWHVHHSTTTDFRRMSSAMNLVLKIARATKMKCKEKGQTCNGNANNDNGSDTNSRSGRDTIDSASKVTLETPIIIQTPAFGAYNARRERQKDGGGDAGATDEERRDPLSSDHPTEPKHTQQRGKKSGAADNGARRTSGSADLMHGQGQESGHFGVRSFGAATQDMLGSESASPLLARGDTGDGWTPSGSPADPAGLVVAGGPGSVTKVFPPTTAALHQQHPGAVVGTEDDDPQSPLITKKKSASSGKTDPATNINLKSAFDDAAADEDENAPSTTNGNTTNGASPDMNVASHSDTATLLLSQTQHERLSGTMAPPNGSTTLSGTQNGNSGADDMNRKPTDDHEEDADMGSPEQTCSEQTCEREIHVPDSPFK